MRGQCVWGIWRCHHITSPVLLKEVLHRFRSANSWTARLMPYFCINRWNGVHAPAVGGWYRSSTMNCMALWANKIIKDHISGSRLRTFLPMKRIPFINCWFICYREQKTLKAYIDRNSSTGYTYPILESRWMARLRIAWWSLLLVKLVYYPVSGFCLYL